ncbi:hypothetical protein P9112_009684 [Eukaryota sp. TZLM1-RC]
MCKQWLFGIFFLVWDHSIDGMGIDVVHHVAFHWFKNAPELGDPDEMYSLGLSYQDDVRRDLRQAITWFEEAKDAGNNGVRKLIIVKKTTCLINNFDFFPLHIFFRMIYLLSLQQQLCICADRTNFNQNIINHI